MFGLSDKRYAAGMRLRIKQLREERGLKQEEVAEKLGLHLTNYNKLENGKTELTTSRMEELAAIFGVDPVAIISEPLAFRSIEVRGVVQAGAWSEAWDWDEGSRYSVPIPDEPRWRSFRLFGAEARGPSMNRRYPEGTVLIVTDQVETGEHLVVGRRYVVERERADGLREATVKTLWRDDAGALWLLPESDDPRFQQPIPISGEQGDTIRILGRVVYAVQREE